VADLDDEIVAFTDAPSETESRDLAAMGRELFNVDKWISDLELRLETARERREALVSVELPDYFTKVGQDRMGLPEFGVDLVLENFVHANIAADWEPERREAAFSWLEDNGHGDMVKVQLTMLFPKTALELARWVQQALTALKLPKEYQKQTMPASDILMTVPWNTLTAWAKDQIKQGAELPLDTLGVTTGRIVKIKKRDEPKQVRKK